MQIKCIAVCLFLCCSIRCVAQQHGLNMTTLGWHAEYYVMSKSIYTFAAVHPDDLEKSYTFILALPKLRFSRSSLGKNSLQLIDTASLDTPSRVRDYRYGIIVYDKDQNRKYSLYIDIFSPSGLLNGKPVRLNAELCAEIKGQLDAIDTVINQKEKEEGGESPKTLRNGLSHPSLKTTDTTKPEEKAK